jgi:beta-galactosidase
MTSSLLVVLVGVIAISVSALRAADTKTVDGPLDSLDAVRSRMRIGAELFLDPSYTPAEIQMHFARMRETGLSLVRLFIIWDHIERQRGQWRFDLYDRAYDAAAANGMHVLATLCPEDPPGWAARTPFYHSKLLLNTPEMREAAAQYVRRAVSRYKDHPAQGLWSLANEPAGLAQSFDPATMQQFGQWLHGQYGSVDTLNQRWFRPIESFDRVSIGPDLDTAGWTDYTALVDWKRFRIQQQSDQIAWVRDQVRRWDTKHLTHVNPSALAYNMPAMGADAWSQKRVVDVLGTTMHASWQVPEYRPSDTDLGFALITDVLRSASGASPWWITELQAGPAVLCASRPYNPTADELARWMWDDIGAGAKGILFWCWNPRRFGREGGEWGLVGADAAATPRSEAVRKIARALAGPARVLHHAEPLPPRVAILYSRQSLILGAIEDRPAGSGGDRVLLSLLGCHRALCGRQIPVAFVDEDALKRGETNGYAVLYLPHAYALDNETAAAIRRYVSEGGTVWADGPIGWKDDYGNVRPEMPGGLVDVFGMKLSDIQPVSEPFSLTGRDAKTGSLLRLPLVLRGAEAIERDARQQPVATRHRYGKGTAIFFATALTHGYHRNADPQAGRWITAPAQPAARQMDVSAVTEAPRILFRGMKCPEGLVAILINPGETASVRVAFRGPVDQVEDLLTAAKFPTVSGDGVRELSAAIPPGQVCVLLARFPKTP